MFHSWSNKNLKLKLNKVPLKHCLHLECEIMNLNEEREEICVDIKGNGCKEFLSRCER